MTISIFVSAMAMFLGAFVAVLPGRAAEIWGSEKLRRLSPEEKISFVRWYRIFGILVWLTGVLFAVDSVFFSKH